MPPNHVYLPNRLLKKHSAGCTPAIGASRLLLVTMGMTKRLAPLMNQECQSGDGTATAIRQYNGNRGKVENCVLGVHLGYSAIGFQTILDSQLYLPEDWRTIPLAEKNYIPDEVVFQTKPQLR